MPSFKLADLEAISKPLTSNAKEWLLDAEQSTDFLQRTTQGDQTLIYASARSVLIHGVLALTRRLTQDQVAQLQDRNIPMLNDSWSIQRVYGGGGRGHRMYLEPPLSSVSKCLGGGEKLIFRRSFTGVSSGRAPIELSQKLIHSLDIHFVPERNAYCRLDSRGDIEDVVKVYQIDAADPFEDLAAVTIKRHELDKFMALSKTCLVLRFDFTRVPWGNFSGWGEIHRYTKDSTDLYYHGGRNGQGSYCNGVLVVRPQVTVPGLVRQWKADEDPSRRQYATFKIFDRKNRTQVETSCAPDCLSNYFQKSNLPWEISPAFFRPEVLHRFKSDPEKYSLKDRSITCRNTWHLETYDINEAGQVHTYIGYLAHLPYEEQLYWQAFNEWPKGPISKRAFQTDIVGDWYLDYDPLDALKHSISLLDASPPAWWKKRGDGLSEAARYPATDSVKEWADELLALDQLLVEGFLLKPLRTIAEKGGRVVDKNWGTLRVMQEVLVTRGHSDEAAKALVTPMQQLHALRTEVRGHATGEKKRAAETRARADSGTLRAHYFKLTSECESALRSIMVSLEVALERSAGPSGAE